MELVAGPFSVSMVESTPDLASFPSVLPLWKLFGFSNPVVTEALLCRVAGLPPYNDSYFSSQFHPFLLHHHFIFCDAVMFPL